MITEKERYELFYEICINSEKKRLLNPTYELFNYPVNGFLLLLYKKISILSDKMIEYKRCNEILVKQVLKDSVCIDNSDKSTLYKNNIEGTLEEAVAELQHCVYSLASKLDIKLNYHDLLINKLQSKIEQVEFNELLLGMISTCSRIGLVLVAKYLHCYCMAFSKTYNFDLRFFYESLIIEKYQ